MASGVVSLLGCAELVVRSVISEDPALAREDAVYFRARFPTYPQTLHLRAPRRGEILVSVGPEGFRGRLDSVASLVSGKRVIVLGSASAFGLGLSDGETFPARLQERLREIPGCLSVEVLNAGLPGASMSDMAGRLLTDLYRFHPDGIVLYHDWTELSGLDSGETVEARAEVARNATRALGGGLSSRFALLRIVSRLYVKARFGIDLHQGNFSPARPLSSVQGGIATVPAEGLRQFGMALRAFVAAAQSSGAKVVLVPELTLLTESSGPESIARVWVNDSLTPAARLEALEKLRQAQHEVARASGSTLVDLHEKMDGRPEFFIDQVHLNPRGAAELAERVAPAIAKDICR